MGLTVLAGPPNSGRAGAIREAIEAAIAAEPILIVPTGDDVSRFERELCAGSEPVIGASVMTFERLFERVAATLGVGDRPRPGPAARRRLIATAVERARPRRIRLPRTTASAVAAVEGAIDEVRLAGLGAGDVRGAGTDGESDGDSELLGDLASILERYEELCEEVGVGDVHRLAGAAIAALRASPDAWGRRPVFVYGFDDLTAAQLALVRALTAAAPTTVAVTFEDRPALAARAGLLGRLRDGSEAEVRTLEPNPSHTSSRALYELERGFLEPGRERVEPDDGIALLVRAGERAEVEAIGARIARLIADGVEPASIAVALRAPHRYGSLYDEVLRGCGVPAAVEASVPVAATSTGRGLLGLLGAVHGDDGAAGLLAYLRIPGRAYLDQVDWLERAVRRGRISGTAEALEAWRGRDLWELERLGEARGAAAICEALGAIARHAVPAGPGPGEAAARLDAGPRREVRAALAIASACEQLAGLGDHAPAAAELADDLAAIEVPLWRGPRSDRVVVGSPYRLRAGRFSHLFCAALQEGEFPAAGGSPTLLSDADRGALGLRERTDPREEERYLFYVCASLPTDRLYLSWRVAGDDGSAQAPSAFVEEVTSLFRPEPAPLERRGPGAPAPSPALAPTPALLARALAAAGPAESVLAALGALELPEQIAAEVGASLTEAARVARDPGFTTLGPGPALGALAERELFGASTLESYATCPAQWFIDRELAPEGLDPRPEPLDQGSIVHEVLERLYREPPGDDALPRPETLPGWIERAGELLAEVAEEAGLGPHDGGRRAGLARMRVMVEAMLVRDSRRDATLVPDPDLLEAAFGPDTEVGALELDGFSMHGKIDRIDVGTAGGARIGLVRDYKAGKRVTTAARLAEDGKLQLPLYMTALRELWGIEPVGGLYEPLGAGPDGRPRGPVLDDAADRVGDASLYRTDLISDSELAEALASARERAGEIVGEVRGGRVARDPIGGVCPRYCSFAPICRRERAAEAPEEEPGNREQRS